MRNEYTVYTSIPGNFDPDVLGVTLVSIVSTCDGYVSHSVPFGENPVRIKMTNNGPLEVDYLVDQLNDNFSEVGENVVLKIVDEARGYEVFCR